MSDLYIEPLIGFRGWKLAPEFPGKLDSMYVNYIWPLDNPEPARHDTEWFIMARNLELPKDHKAPTPGCACGYYAHADLQRALAVFDTNRQYRMIVNGVVLGWGRVVIHEQGFRAEYMKPIAFMDVSCPEDAEYKYLREQCAMNYRVPILSPEVALEYALERGRLWK